MKVFKNLLYVLFVLIFFISCYNTKLQETEFIKIKGSDTMLILTRLWAQEYMKNNQNISIYTEGGGSATGFRALIDGKADICASSRPMKAYEVRQLAEKHSRLGISFYVGKDALSIYLNKENPVNNLSLQQLQDIYTGRIKNWSEVGGSNDDISLISRSPNSGSFLHFKEHVLIGESYSENIQVFNTTNAVISQVELNKNAIGYGGIAYGENIKHAYVNNIAPTIDNVRNNIYPISRYLYFYTIDTPTGEIKDFIDWILSKSGQAIVAKSGYIPLWPGASNQ